MNSYYLVWLLCANHCSYLYINCTLIHECCYFPTIAGIDSPGGTRYERDIPSPEHVSLFVVCFTGRSMLKCTFGPNGTRLERNAQARH